MNLIRMRKPLCNIVKPAWILALPVAILISCNTYKTFNINVMEPADLIVPQNIHHLLIACNFQPDTSGLAIEIYGENYLDTLYSDTAFAAVAIEYLAGALGYNERFTATPYDSLFIDLPAAAEEISSYDLKRLKDICMAYEADAVVLLSDVGKQIEYEVYTSIVGGYYSIFNVVLSTKWLFINPFTSRLIDQKSYRDTLFYRISGFYGTREPELYQAARELMFQTAEYTAGKYSSRISPHFAESTRIVFDKGYKHLKKGYQMAQSGDWVKAAEIWQKTLTNKSPLISARGAFNIALANEMEGLLEPAIGWAEESYKLFPDSINYTYIEILKERLRQQDDLLKQMEGQ